MSWRRTDHRLAAIDAYRAPAIVRQRFAAEHDKLAQADLDQVESATRQWFRLAARHPRAKLTMPSSAAYALWRGVALQTDYAAFSKQAFGRRFPPPPADAASPPGVDFGALAETHRLARQDEPGGPTALPLLFRIDQQLKFPGGRRYLADCGGRGTCYDVPGALCLQHLQGAGRPVRGRNPFGPPPPDYSSPGGGGPGCGGGAG
ncbi:hypothetical protein [Actinoplanes sp. M2I2]|uniref:hypothetical protein n=1 Tax=Actinoplanes sp. M2I2 TaxID=1734444 RepID=UPI0020223B1C|nr:hypothetical protein [Actinoplanes sp. M2I2]